MQPDTAMKPRHPATARLSRTLLRLATVALAAQLCSCIQPPPPRTYNPTVSARLRQVSHDTPVTPLPGTGGAWIYECY